MEPSGTHLLVKRTRIKTKKSWKICYDDDK